MSPFFHSGNDDHENRYQTGNRARASFSPPYGQRDSLSATRRRRQAVGRGSERAGLSREQVREALISAQEKLEASNLMHAVSLAMLIGVIEHGDPHQPK